MYFCLLDSINLFLKNNLLYGDVEFELLQPTKMCLSPATFASVIKTTVTKQKGIQSLFGGFFQPLHILSSTDRVAHRFPLLVGHSNGDEFTGSIQSTKLFTITPIRFYPITGFGGYQRGGDDAAMVAKLADFPVYLT